MHKSWILWLIPFALFVAACTPTAQTVPASDPVFYAAEPLEVMGAAIEAISTSPGLDDSNGWLITQADTQGGFVRAETEVTVPGGLFRRASTRTEWLTVVVSAAGENRTQVIIQRTDGAESLAERVQRELRAEFGLN
jgi:hypothetical protein